MELQRNLVLFVRLYILSFFSFVLSEEEMVECLNGIDMVTEEKKNYAEATRVKRENLRLENVSKYKMIKREGNKVEVYPTKEVLREKNERQ